MRLGGAPIFSFRDHIGMALQRRRQPAGTGTAWEQNGEWSAPFDGSPLLVVFGDRCVDALEFAGQCSQAEPGFIDLSSVCTDSFSESLGRRIEQWPRRVYRARVPGPAGR